MYNFYFICLKYVYLFLFCFIELLNMDYCLLEDFNCYFWCIEYVDKC